MCSSHGESGTAACTKSSGDGHSRRPAKPHCWSGGGCESRQRTRAQVVWHAADEDAPAHAPHHDQGNQHGALTVHQLSIALGRAVLQHCIPREVLSNQQIGKKAILCYLHCLIQANPVGELAAGMCNGDNERAM